MLTKYLNIRKLDQTKANGKYGDEFLRNERVAKKRELSLQDNVDRVENLIDPFDGI